MEVTGLRIKLRVMALILLMAEDHKSEGGYLHVHPNALQFFEYESISLTCTGFHGPAEWRAIKKLGLNSTQWETSRRTLDIKPAYISHSGEYWCENEDGEKSETVNITVTSGDVVLEIPAFPVIEGDNVTLSCRKKKKSSHLLPDFHKDGHRIGTGYAGNLTICNVSKSNEGLYKCSFSQSQGTSAESWLAVRAYNVPAPRDNQDSLPDTPSPISLPAVFTTLGVAVLIVVGVFYCRKHRGRQGANAPDPHGVTYAAVTIKPKRERVCRQTDGADPNKATYAAIAKRNDRGP